MIVALICLAIAIAEVWLVMWMAWDHPLFWMFFWLWLCIQVIANVARKALRSP